MQINDIKALVARLEAIVEGWDEKSGAPAVERHIAASLLAELYEAVKFDTALAATPIAKVEVHNNCQKIWFNNIPTKFTSQPLPALLPSFV